MANVLVVDDDELICNLVCRRATESGHTVEKASTLADAKKKVYSKPFDVVFLDVRLPDGNGLDGLPWVKKAPSSPEVIIITGHSDPEGAESAIRGDAWDYIQKPFTKEQLNLQIVRTLQYREGKKNQETPVALRRDDIIGNSLPINQCLDLVAQAAIGNFSVLISGETGTGKEVFARAIHTNSPRSNGNFVIVDCTALPEHLVESILFGHEKGAFTGADRAYEGVIRQAEGGTIFLDEIGELPLSMQKKFLRVLQSHTFRPIGGKSEQKVDFRLVAATNRNLNKMASRGQFREDLLFRLKSFGIELPPLRNRLEDIEDLTAHYIKKICTRYSLPSKGYSPDFLETLKAHNWPGNVRELVNTIESVLAASSGEPTLFARHLPVSMRVKQVRALFGGTAPNEDDKLPLTKKLPSFRSTKQLAMERVEQQYLAELVSQTAGNISQACRMSGLSQPRLYALLKKHKITRLT